MATRKAGKGSSKKGSSKKGSSKKGASKKGGAKKGASKGGARKAGGAAAGHVSLRDFTGKARRAGGAASGHVSGRIIRGRAVNASQIIQSVLRRREWVMYGIPIFNVAATGNIAEMRRVSQAARTHLDDVQQSLASLDQAIRAGGR